MAFGGLIGKETQVDLSQYVTETELNSKGFATQSWVSGQGYVTQNWVEDKINSIVTVEGFSILNDNWYYRKLFVENSYNSLPFSINLPSGNIAGYCIYYNFGNASGSSYLSSYYKSIEQRTFSVYATQNGNIFSVNVNEAAPIMFSASSNPNIATFSRWGSISCNYATIDFFIKIVS